MAKSLWEDECHNEAARSEEEWRRKEKWYGQQELDYAEGDSTSRHPHSERNVNNPGQFKRPYTSARNKNSNFRPYRKQKGNNPQVNEPRRGHYYQGHRSHPQNNYRNQRQDKPTIRQVINNYQGYNDLPQINHANQGKNEPTMRQSNPKTGQIRRQDSITELIAESCPQTIPRALSNSFLPTGRHPNMQEIIPP